MDETKPPCSDVDVGAEGQCLHIALAWKYPQLLDVIRRESLDDLLELGQQLLPIRLSTITITFV